MSDYSVAARENLQSFFTKAIALLQSRPWLFLLFWNNQRASIFLLIFYIVIH